MNNRCLILMLICITVLFGCSSQTDQNPTVQNPTSQNTIVDTKILNPVITPSNAKLFTYIVIDHAEERRNNMPTYWKKQVDRGTKSLDETRKRRNPEIVIERRKTIILSELSTELAKTGFCRDGHTIINSHFELARSSIKGKCNDSATSADRVKFASAVSTTKLDPLREGLLDTPK